MVHKRLHKHRRWRSIQGQGAACEKYYGCEMCGQQLLVIRFLLYVARQRHGRYDLHGDTGRDMRWQKARGKGLRHVDLAEERRQMAVTIPPGNRSRRRVGADEASHLSS